MNLSDTIKDLCRELDISCSELARRSGQSVQNLNKKINRNTLSFEEFEKLLKLMDVEMDCSFTLPGGEPSKNAVADEYTRDQLEILEKQLEVERMKNKCFARISYDLRTSLNTVSGAIDLAAAHKNDAGKIEELLGKMRYSVNQITRLVEDNPFNREMGVSQGESKPAETEDDLLEGRRVLLVEDNELNRDILKEILEDNGCVITEAEDGEQAVERVKKLKTKLYDFILMDIQMPVMDGFAATTEIRKMQNRSKADIPIFAMTASVTEEDRRRAMLVGMNGFLEKPLNINIFKQMLSETVI